MRGRRPGKTGGVFAGIHGEFFLADHDADGHGLFAAVERSITDRLLWPSKYHIEADADIGILLILPRNSGYLKKGGACSPRRWSSWVDPDARLLGSSSRRP